MKSANVSSNPLRDADLQIFDMSATPNLSNQALKNSPLHGIPAESENQDSPGVRHLIQSPTQLKHKENWELIASNQLDGNNVEGKEDDQKTHGIMDGYKIRKFDNSDQVSFKIDVFAEFFLYHFLFYFLLGPPGMILLLPCVKKQMLQNQQFWGTPSIFQGLTWAFTFSTLALYLYDRFGSDDYQNIYPVEISDLFVITFIRIIFICCKYAYCSPKFLKIYRSRVITPEELSGELIVGSFFGGGKPGFVNEHLQESILRLKIDTSTFYFTFLGYDPDPNKLLKYTKEHAVSNALLKLMERLKYAQKTRRSNSGVLPLEKSKTQLDFADDVNPFDSRKITLSEVTFKDFKKLVSKEHSFEKEMLSGYSLCTELITDSRNAVDKTVFLLNLLIGAVRAILPLIARVIEGKPIIGSSTLEKYIIIAIMINTFIFFMLNHAVASVSSTDMKIKLHLLNHITNLLPNCTAIEDNRRTPPLNIFNPISLQSWESFREALTDYGEKFQTSSHYENLFEREDNFNAGIPIQLQKICRPLYLTVYLVQMVIVILYLLKIIKIDVGVGTALVMSYEVLIVLSLFLALLVRGAMINDYFGLHRNRLLYIKKTFAKMIVMKEFYLGNKEIETDNELIKEGVLYFRRIFEGEEDFVGKCGERLDLLEKIVCDMIDNLDATAVEKPFQIFGFRIQWDTIKALGAALLSLGVAIYQVRVNSSG